MYYLDGSPPEMARAPDNLVSASRSIMPRSFTFDEYVDVPEHDFDLSAADENLTDTPAAETPLEEHAHPGEFATHRSEFVTHHPSQFATQEEARHAEEEEDEEDEEDPDGRSEPADGSADAPAAPPAADGKPSKVSKFSGKGKPRWRPRAWSPEEDEKLKQLVATYGENEVDWEAVALQLVQRSEWQCRDRWNRALDPSRIKGPWTPEEDATITRLVAEFGPTKWSRIAAHLPGRLNKQCRERWHNQLDPSIRKESFTAEEDETLINAHRQMGNRWAEIARLLPGRTDNAVKNHWNNSVRRRLQRQMAENPNIGPVHPDHLAALQQPIRKKRSAAGKRARAAAEAAAAAAAAGGELVGVASGPKSTDVSGSVGAADDEHYDYGAHIARAGHTTPPRGGDARADDAAVALSSIGQTPIRGTSTPDLVITPESAAKRVRVDETGAHFVMSPPTEPYPSAPGSTPVGSKVYDMGTPWSDTRDGVDAGATKMVHTPVSKRHMEHDADAVEELLNLRRATPVRTPSHVTPVSAHKQALIL